MEFCTVFNERQSYMPLSPPIFRSSRCPQLVPEKIYSIDASVKSFLHDSTEKAVLVCSGEETSVLMGGLLRVGVLFGGGPAPGGHTVLYGIFEALKQYEPEAALYGFHDGFSGLLKQSYTILTQEVISSIKNTGGLDALGTSRVSLFQKNILNQAVASIKALKLDALLCIGGDDTQTDAVYLSQALLEAGCTTRIIGVPKTIDCDLQSEDISLSFGFDTACGVYSEEIGNIAKDILSTKKYTFFIRVMGRYASHIALECALRTHPNMCLISEEVCKENISLGECVQIVATLVERRVLVGKPYGLIIIPEGLIEHFPDVRLVFSEVKKIHHTTPEIFSMKPQERLDAVREKLSVEAVDCFSQMPGILQEQLFHEIDAHGNIPVSSIETERLLAELVRRELLQREQTKGVKIPFYPQTFFCGYEGRCAYPTNFDCDYCYSLGRLAVVLACNGCTGYLAGIRHLEKDVSEWKCVGIPLVSLLAVEDRGGQRRVCIQKTVVDLEGAPFQAFAKARASWAMDDVYKQRGPAQFSSQKPFILLCDKGQSDRGFV